MKEITTYEVTQLMLKRGGSFIKSLAACWRCADESNKKKLEEAFSDYFDEYKKQAEEIQAEKEQELIDNGACPDCLSPDFDEERGCHNCQIEQADFVDNGD